jgi:hypothetical protein
MPTFLQSVPVRWLVAFVGFLIGSLVGHTVAGPAATVPSALLSGILAGAVIGLGQGLALNLRSQALVVWAAVTAIGVGVVLAVVNASIGQVSTASEAVTLGAATGLVLGAGQAVLLQRRGVPSAWIWAPVSAVAWAAGWLVSTSIGVSLEPGWPVYGGVAALISQLITGVLVWRLIATPPAIAPQPA